MGLYVYIHVHQEENVVFDDLAKLNEDLSKGEVGELLENVQHAELSMQAIFSGYIKQNKGKISFANFPEGEFEGYESEYVYVYGCFEDESLQIIADHMTNGKLVLRKEIEGNPGFYYVLTPGNVKTIEETSIRF